MFSSLHALPALRQCDCSSCRVARVRCRCFAKLSTAVSIQTASHVAQPLQRKLTWPRVAASHRLHQATHNVAQHRLAGESLSSRRTSESSGCKEHGNGHHQALGGRNLTNRRCYSTELAATRTCARTWMCFVTVNDRTSGVKSSSSWMTLSKQSWAVHPQGQAKWQAVNSPHVLGKLHTSRQRTCVVRHVGKLLHQVDSTVEQLVVEHADVDHAVGVDATLHSTAHASATHPGSHTTTRQAVTTLGAHLCDLRGSGDGIQRPLQCNLGIGRDAVH